MQWFSEENQNSFKKLQYLEFLNDSESEYSL